MSRALLHLIVGIFYAITILVFMFLSIYTIWNFSYLLLKLDLSLLWFMIVLNYFDKQTK